MQSSRHLRTASSLPPGQRELDEFPRFGVTTFAKRPIRRQEVRLEVSGVLDSPLVLGQTELTQLPRVTLTRDFHCAAGWTCRELAWTGVRFQDMWRRFIAPHVRESDRKLLVILRSEDGFRTSLPIEDLLVPDVLLADQLNSEPLTVEHGAPLRLIAPAHYGYKSAKHLVRIELCGNDRRYRPLLPRFMDHPRARVDLEERGQFLPGWLLRYLFRPFIKPMIRRMKRITASHLRGHERPQ